MDTGKPKPAVNAWLWKGNLLVLAVNILLIVHSSFKDSFVRYHLGLKPYYGTDSTFSVGNALLRIRDDWHTAYSFVEIKCPTGSTWSQTGRRYLVYDFANNQYTNEDIGAPEYTGYRGARSVLCKDVNADGTDEVMIAVSRGGPSVHHWIVSLGDAPRTIAEIDSPYDRLEPVDVDKDGVYELKGYDCCPLAVFWKATGRRFTDLPLIFAWKAGKYVLSTPSYYDCYSDELARQVAAFPAVLEDWRKGEYRVSKRHTPPGTYIKPPYELPDILLNHIYLGQGAKARELLDQLWPPENPGVDVFLKEFDFNLRRNCTYWRDVNEATAPENRWPAVPEPLTQQDTDRYAESPDS